MKTFLRRIYSCALTLSLLAVLAVPAAASDALGEDLTSRETQIHQGTCLSQDVFWSSTYSDLRTENLVTYQPNAAVTPIVTYGGALTDCNTVSATAKALENQGYRVVAGINGDFYNTSTGLPIGLMVANGELKASDGGYYAIGFRADGTAVLGKPSLAISADLGYQGTDSSGYSTEVLRNIAAVNKARVSTGGIYLYTYDFNAKHTTGTTEPGVDVVCSVQSGSLSIGGTVTLTVETVLQDTYATAVPEGRVVLTANNQANSYYTDALKNIPVGATITIATSAASEEWNDVRYGLGALYSLVENGAVVSDLPTGANPRTAVGQKADGTLVFYTIDGRQAGYSIGATMAQVAQRLVELGCTTALCLDGGGSTTLAVTEPDATAAQTVNQPSGGSERAVSNHIFLVATNQPSGTLDHYYVSPDNNYVLAGSTVQISASAVDTNYIPISGRGYTLSTSGGTLTGDVLTTPAAGGTVTVTASGGGKSGSATVYAVTTPDSITVKNGSSAVSSLTVTPGGSVSLTASAVYQHLALKADAAAFKWTVSGGIGTVDSTGKFTASTPGTGVLTVSAGGKSTTVAVTVSTVPLSTLEDFESGAPAATSYSYGAAMTANTDTAYVKYGRQSGALAYTLGADGTATWILDNPATIGSAYTILNLWVYGDNSGNALSVLVSDGSGTSEISAGTLDFTGWKQLSVTLPAGTTAFSGIKVTGTPQVEQLEDGSYNITFPASSGTLYFDQIVASYNSIVDTAVPTVSASVSGTALTATVSDADGDTVPAKSGVSVTCDGSAVDFNYNTATGALTATLPISDTNAHRVTVTARDASGNIGRASCDVASANTEPIFSDTVDYWGQSYVDWLKTAGITTGYDDGTFRPNQSITRQQFAVMLYRYLGLDGSQYESVALPFADSADIAEYAQTPIKTLYSLGILNGSQVNGKLYFYPGSSLTRAQAATMIGRTQPMGYAQSALSFSDQGKIPAYATYYIQTMLAQKIISGYEDSTFRPNANITRGQMAKILYNVL